jgi:hypothetical protein
MTTMPMTVNLSDVAPVDTRILALAMRSLVDSGRGLAMLRGIGKEELAIADRALCAEMAVDPALRVAALMRLRCLVEVFATSRLANLFLNVGYNLIAPAVEVAAAMRLNAERGFSAVKFERALAETMARMDAERREAGIGLAA